MQDINKKIFYEAKQAMKNAYAPYSGFHVGACIETDTGKLYAGCNVENASYGLTSCAEASAISNMITAGEKTIKRIAIIADGKELTGPCGGCRQRIYEFAESKTIPVILFNTKGNSESKTLNELLPFAFGPESLT